MARYISFDFMFKDTITTRVNIEDDGKVSIENFTDDIYSRAFGVKTDITIEDVKYLFSTRVMPRTRANCKEVLKHICVPFYDEYLICRKTNGATTDDYSWIRFDDRKNLTWDDVKFRT